MKLFYFDIPGKGESIRLLCAHAGLPIEDVRISTSNRQVFDDLKNNGKLPFGKLPALQVTEEGPMITQSAAIMRYLGKLSSLYPICPIKAALVDAIIDEETDLTTGLSVSRYRGKIFEICLSHLQTLSTCHLHLSTSRIYLICLDMSSACRFKILSIRIPTENCPIHGSIIPRSIF